MNRQPEESLEWPSHFPPTDKVQKFFIGIRWLGPDLRFFGELREQQARRSQTHMDAWMNPDERQMALLMGRHFHHAVGWRREFFLPADRFQVIAYGPRFQTVDDLGFEQAIFRIEKELGIEFEAEFWQRSFDLTFAEVVKNVLKRKTEFRAVANR